MTAGNGRGRAIRAWIATLVPVIGMAVAAIWWGVEVHFQAEENTRDLERQAAQIQLNRDLIWERTGYSHGGE